MTATGSQITAAGGATQDTLAGGAAGTRGEDVGPQNYDCSPQRTGLRICEATTTKQVQRL